MARSHPDTDHTNPATASERVVHAVADAKDLDPLELPPLYEVVDPDALNKLFDSGGCSRTGPGRVVIGVAGCEVTVHSNGRVEVDAGPDPSVEPAFTDRNLATDGAETRAGE